LRNRRKPQNLQIPLSIESQLGIFKKGGVSIVTGGDLHKANIQFPTRNTSQENCGLNGTIMATYTKAGS
jgi:hypothetical protein